MARKKGSKQLINVGYGSRENKFGVRFTASELKKFRNEVQRVNARLTTYTKNMQSIRNLSESQIDSRIPVEPLFQKKSASVQKFRSKEEFRSYMAKLNRQGSDAYRDYRYSIEKENFKKAIRNTFSKQDADVLIKKINKMTPRRIHNLMISKQLEHTGFVYYDPNKTKFNILKEQLDKA